MQPTGHGVLSWPFWRVWGWLCAGVPGWDDILIRDISIFTASSFVTQLQQVQQVQQLSLPWMDRGRLELVALRGQQGGRRCTL